MDELKSLKERMLAIREGNFDVEAPNPRLVKCWERLNCDRINCPAYGRLRCWSIAGTLCHGRIQGKFALKLGDCRQCVVYREACGDEIGELLEIFNQMLKDIKFNLHERERSSREQARGDRQAELGDLVAAVAHETRNPLHAIGLAASCLKKKFPREAGAEFVAVIEEEVRRLSELTSRFMSFSQPAPLRLGSCDLNAEVAAVVDSYRREAAAQKVSLAMQPDRGLPVVTSDPGRVRAALSHLLDNALAASPPQGTIGITTGRREGEVAITVRDAGPGIAPADREKVFRPFYTTRSKGAGLGLAIAGRLIAELGGRIELESAPGQGSTFTMVLPAETAC